MTLIPAVLVLTVGSQVVLDGRRSLVQRADGRGAVVGEPASPPTTTTSGSAAVVEQAARLARALSAARSVAPDVGAVREQRRAATSTSGASAWCRSTACVARRTAESTCVPVVDVAVADDAARAGRGRRPTGWPRASRPVRAAAVDARAGRRRRRSRCAPPASFATPRGSSTGVVVASDYLSGDLADRSRRMTEGLRGLHPAARAEAAAGRRLPVVLRHGHAADPGQLDLDGVLSRQADHAAGADAVGGGARNRRRATTISASSTRRPTSSDR